ncbi:VWA domain-containing protein [Asanoa sp. WMMD1127]|uniref:vWA domain-containing protein n=1 Tax=Asanoa sp. WMMD1127 TaxID=3016107 RepID=UPI0024174D5A|nr:VWA domain-containing protein [Asanoa sp. WMMD1127]MDG4825326.1 VWA domain-containing protein [Asanoa sp. WMMD1127]
MTTVDPRLVARTEDHLFRFLRALHDHGVRVPANKQTSFFAGIDALAPSTTGQLYWVGAATLVTSEPDLQVYEAVFQRFFGAAADALVVGDEPTAGDTEDEPTGTPGESPTDDLAVAEAGGAGLAAARVSPDRVRRFASTGPRAHDLMRQLGHELPHALPNTRSRRRQSGGARQRLDLRAVFLDSRRTYGEITRLHWRHRPPRPRRVLVLVDVSGSMKQHSADYLRFAHAVVATCPRAEVFTFGTRLTRVTAALRRSDVDEALAGLAQLVLDADGGTLIGPSLRAFLDNTHHTAMARGALVLVLSDGLERGDATAMVAAVRRLSLLGHRLCWWSPLACDPGYRPVTRGMAAVLGHLDALTGVQDLDTALTAVRAKFATQRRGGHG